MNNWLRIKLPLTLCLNLALGLLLGGAPLASAQAATASAQPEHGITLQDLIEQHPEVKTIHQKCSKGHAASPTAGALSEGVAQCMWEEIEKKPELKKAVLATLNLQTKTPEDSTGKKKTATPSAADKKIKQAFQDPALENLRQFLFTQYMKALQEDNGRQVLTSHEVFYQLYATQVEKNILEAISNYCLKTTFNLAYTTYDPLPEVKKEDGTLDENATQKLREKNQKIIEAIIDYNLAQLQTINPAQEQEDPKNKNAAAQKLQKNQSFSSPAYQNWVGCSTHLEHLCYLSKGGVFRYQKDGDKKPYEISLGDENFSRSLAKNKSDDSEGGLIIEDSTPTTDDDDYTQQQACLVTQYLKDLRSNLKATREITQQVDASLNKGALLTSHEKKSYKNFNASDAQEGIDALTTLTSGELMHDAALDAGMEEQVKKVEDCVASAGTLSADCRKILQAYQDQDKEDQAMRKLLDRALKEDAITTANDAASMQRYLAHEGYTTEQIKAMINDEEKMQKIKDTIKDKYKKERLALAASLREQIQQNRRPSAEDTREGQKVEDLEKDQLKLIEQELKYRQDTYPKIVHYNNVVTSFISIEGSDAQKKTFKGQNFAALFQELNNNYFARGASTKATPLAQEVATQNKEYAEQLAKNVEKSGIKKPSQYDSSTLSVETINDVFLSHGAAESTPTATAETPSTEESN